MATASTFMIHCREYDDLSLAIVDGEPVLAKVDSRDERQVPRLHLLLASFCCF